VLLQRVLQQAVKDVHKPAVGVAAACPATGSCCCAVPAPEHIRRADGAGAVKALHPQPAANCGSASEGVIVPAPKQHPVSCTIGAGALKALQQHLAGHAAAVVALAQFRLARHSSAKCSHCAAKGVQRSITSKMCLC
jgi:hypothetical protein